MINQLDKASLPEPASNSKPFRDPAAHFPPVTRWLTAAGSRESRPPLDPRSRAAFPIRIDPSDVIDGDRFGCRVILSMSCESCRSHGFPCHCTWQDHTIPGCSYDNPSCPCYAYYVRYRVVCRCDCGAIKEVSLEHLVCGVALSCGKHECMGSDDNA
jgi:hypothetical protein